MKNKNYKYILFLFIFIYFGLLLKNVSADFFYTNPDSGLFSNICATTLQGCNNAVQKIWCSQTGASATCVDGGKLSCGTATPSPPGSPNNSAYQPYVCPAAATPVDAQKTASNAMTPYTPLAPLPNEPTGTALNWGSYLNFLVKIIIGLCGALAVIMLVIGGIMYMGDESIFGRTEAKKQMTNAILGLLIALGAWVLLNTINPDILKGTATIQTVTATISSPDIPQAQPAAGQTYPNTNYTTDAAWPSDQTTRTALQQAGISVSGANCTTVGQKNCTSVYNLNTSLVLQLQQMCTAKSIDCQLVITGGTEFWLHSANTKLIHYPGGFTVDLQKTTGLSSLIHSWAHIDFSNWYQGSGATCYYSSTTGIGIVEESKHFHVFSSTGGCTTQGV